MDGLLVETTRRILGDRAGAPDAWRGPLWRALEESGLTRAWVPEELGGAGGGLDDGFAILGVAGSFALAAPLAETLLGGWLLADAGLAVPAGPLTVADGFALDGRGRLAGRATRVPFAADADHLAVRAGAMTALVARAQATVVPGRNLAGEPRDDVILDGVAPVSA